MKECGRLYDTKSYFKTVSTLQAWDTALSCSYSLGRDWELGSSLNIVSSRAREQLSAFTILARIYTTTHFTSTETERLSKLLQPSKSDLHLACHDAVSTVHKKTF